MVNDCHQEGEGDWGMPYEGTAFEYFYDSCISLSRVNALETIKGRNLPFSSGKRAMTIENPATMALDIWSKVTGQCRSALN